MITPSTPRATSGEHGGSFTVQAKTAAPRAWHARRPPARRRVNEHQRPARRRARAAAQIRLGERRATDRDGAPRRAARAARRRETPRRSNGYVNPRASAGSSCAQSHGGCGVEGADDRSLDEPVPAERLDPRASSRATSCRREPDAGACSPRNSSASSKRRQLRRGPAELRRASSSGPARPAP